jgi:hypothetical protein
MGPVLLGSLREDVWHIPVVDYDFEHWSFSHFYKPPLPGGFDPAAVAGPAPQGQQVLPARVARARRRSEPRRDSCRLGASRTC